MRAPAKQNPVHPYYSIAHTEYKENGREKQVDDGQQKCTATVRINSKPKTNVNSRKKKNNKKTYFLFDQFLVTFKKCF